MNTKQLPQGWKEVELGDILDYEQPNKYIIKGEILEDKSSTSIPVLTANKAFILGYTNEEEGIYDKLPVIIFDDFTTDNKFVNFKFKIRSSAMKLLIPKTKDVDLKFIFLLIQTIKFNSTTHKRYYLSTYQKIKINLPPLQIQKQIVAILEKAEKLKQNRKEADKLTKEYLQSVFNDMFYNKGFEIKKFRDISKLSQGLQIPISERKNKPSSNSLIYITIQYLNGKREPEYIENPKANVTCKKEDVLMTRTGNTGQVVTDVEGVFHNNFFKVDYDRNKINKVYLVYFLKQEKVRQFILSQAGQSTIPDLNHGDFYNIKIPVPPLQIQQKFASIVKQVEILKEKQKQSKEEINQMFDSLMKQAFNGELVK